MKHFMFWNQSQKLVVGGDGGLTKCKNLTPTMVQVQTEVCDKVLATRTLWLDVKKTKNQKKKTPYIYYVQRKCNWLEITVPIDVWVYCYMSLYCTLSKPKRVLKLLHLSNS